MTLVPRPFVRAGGAALGGVLALGLLVGCSDEPDEGPDDPATSAAETESTEPTASAATMANYLPVPVGVMLTDPGTGLRLDETATVAWRPRQDRVAALDLTVTRIEETSFRESFEGWVVSKEMRAETPYFVRVTATNVSADDLGGLLVPLYAVDDGAIMVEPLEFREDTFAPCPGGTLPERFRPGKEAELCLVYLAPAGRALAAVAFDPVGELGPISWTGKIRKVKDEKGKGDKKSRRDRKRDRQAG